jgi:hypothetical protein
MAFLAETVKQSLQSLERQFPGNGVLTNFGFPGQPIRSTLPKT